MSPDLKFARVYVVAHGPLDGAAAAKALDRHRKYLRGVVARRVDLKYAPDLAFRADDRFDEAGRIDALLRSDRVARDLGSDDDPED